MPAVLQQVMDALDVETFLVCSCEDEGRKLIMELMKDIGFKDIDVVFIEFMGPGVRVRARAYLHRAGDRYGWLLGEGGETEHEFSK
ncbi:hypothetical protein BR63_02175 [Thermanaerosceptrum fracticalcis]|uniref:Uncharacterized protein n=1 Tax=Thermanaerosceptrum fracticalcis TaxID=1712410 RepID=A0A7G6DZH1_THEFR|nr:hypothetical protein [Thermanaerosceptrum fracticalcis]QNB45225.1 hypothetical protein BR63_02175 [Thermanaerosceptrum fracticalcis]